MSSQQDQPQQPTVRHIPIFVEGRTEPLVNITPQAPPSQSSHHSAGMEKPNMEIPTPNKSDFFKPGGSIFEMARDMPVRTFPNSTFMSKPPGFKREPSPGASRTSPFPDGASHIWPEAESMNPNVPRGSSIPRQTPSPPTANQQQQQQPQQPQHQQHQQQQKQAHQKQQTPQPQRHPDAQSQPPSSQQTAGQDQPDSRPSAPSKPDPISKIQKIQKDVLAIFDQVEHFKGGKDGKKDKTYMFLDEMLTQQLLKLDSIDAEDRPQIKSARKEAIKSINTCIAVLEAKAEAGAYGSSDANSIGSNSKNSSSNDINVNNGPDPSTAVAGKSASNTSLPHSSSNSSQANEAPKQ